MVVQSSCKMAFSIGSRLGRVHAVPWTDYSPTQRIEEIPDHSGSRCRSKGMPGLEVDEASAAAEGLRRTLRRRRCVRVWGRSFICRGKRGQEGAEGANERKNSRRAMAQLHSHFAGTLRGGVDGHY